MKLFKSITAIAVAGALLVGSSLSASACMGVYVGKNVSETGAAYIGRSEDIGDRYNKIFTVHPAEKHQPGDLYTDPYGFTMEYPSETYRYTLVKDSPKLEMKDENDLETYEAYQEAFAEAGINENDVAVSATVSTAYNKEARAADPLVGTGICEISLGTVMLSQAKTARHAVELLGDIIDKHGSGECNTILISDPNETWYLEIVSGHQYAAVKLPDDKVAAIPNMMLLGAIDVNDTENVIASEGLVSVPKEAGFLVEENGMIHVAKTYSTPYPGNGQLTRLWQGVYFLNAAQADQIDIASAEGQKAGAFDLLFSPDRKVSTKDVLDFLGYRGVGTQYDSNANRNIYPIGNNNQAECHVMEMRPGMASGLVGIEWLAMSRAEYSLYLPFYAGLITETLANYQYEDLEYNQNSVYWTFCELADLCDDNRADYGTNVQKFWSIYQDKLIEQQAEVDQKMVKLMAKDPEAAQAKATELGKAVAKEALGYAQQMLAELQAFVAEGKTGTFMPSALANNSLPTYSFTMAGEDYDFDDDVPSGDPTDKPSADPADKPSSDSASSGTNSPQTGDFTDIGAFALMLAVAASVLVIGKKAVKKQ